MLSTRTARLVARVLTAVALTAGAVTAVAAPASAEDAPAAITLMASNNVPSNGESVLLTAQTVNRPAASNEYIEIFDSYGWLVDYCQGGYSCYTWVSANDGPHTYVAYVTTQYEPYHPPLSAQSASNPVTVAWTPRSMTLTATPPVNTVGGSIRLDAVSDAIVNYNPYVTIWDITSSPTPVKTCHSYTCSVDVTSATVGTRRYHALLTNWNWNSYYPWAADAQATADAEWVNPLPPSSSIASSLCDDGNQVVDSTTQGVHTKMYFEQVSPQETHVCVRVENGTDGVGFGGRFVITPTVPGAGVTNVQLPSTDTQSGLCTTTTPNSVPGQHPLTAGGIAGTSYLIDSYATTGGAWVCLEAGTTKLRLKVPVAVPSVTVTPGTQVRFDADPQTPDLI